MKKLLPALLFIPTLAFGGGVSTGGTTGGGDALTTNPLSQFAATTSAQLFGVLSDETGSASGALAVFSQSPSIDSPTITTGITLSSAPLTISGNISSAAWTTNGLRIKGTPGTLTDTSSSGTVAKAYTDVLGGNTIAASNATTFTNYFTQYNKDPIAGTNVTLSNKWALGGDSMSVGTSNPVTITTAGVLSATSPVFVTPALGIPASAVLTNATGLPIGSGVSGLGAGVATFLASPSFANFNAATTSDDAAGLAANNAFTGVNTFSGTALPTLPDFSGSGSLNGYLGARAVFADTGASSTKNSVLLWHDSDFASELVFATSGGTLSSPTNAWTGGTGQLGFVGYVGGSINAWRGFSTMEAGQDGTTPTSESDVVGKHQLGVSSGGREMVDSTGAPVVTNVGASAGRGGLKIAGGKSTDSPAYVPYLIATDAVPLHFYRIGMQQVASGYPSANYERGFFGWNGTTFTDFNIATQNGGTGVARNIVLTPSSNLVEQRNGTSAQKFGVYNTYASSTSYERVFAGWPSATIGAIGTEKGSGGGLARKLQLVFGGEPVIELGGNYSIFTGNYPMAFSSTGSAETLGTAFSNSDLRWYRTASGVLTWDNNSGGWTRMNFGGTSNSKPSLGVDAVNGFTFQSAAGTATWNDASTANSGTVANRYLLGIAAPTLTSTGTSVTNTVASTVYIGGAPTDSTNTTSTTKWALDVATGNTNLGGTLTVGSANATNVKNIRHGVSGNMIAGVVTVTDAGCTANTRYFFTTHTIGTVTSPGTYYASTRTAGTSFIITGNQLTETSTIDWLAIEP